MTAIDRETPSLNTRIQDQISRIRLTVFVAILVSSLGILGICVLSSVTEMPLSDFTRDPAAITHSKFYIGILSNIGVMLWSATASICLSAAFFLRYYENVSEIRRFLFSFGLLTLLLGLDDAIEFHERLFPHVLHIRERVVMAAYVIIMAGCLLRYYRTIFKTNYLLLILAFTFLGTSVSVDKVFPNADHHNSFIEDGFKFAGIVFWLAYFFDSVSEIIRVKSPGAGRISPEQ